MRVLRAIAVSSLAIPALVFLVFLGAGLVVLGLELASSGKYSNGWIGIIYAGGVYACFAALLSTIPTIVIGIPASLMARKYGLLNNKTVLIGAGILGGMFLGVSAILFFETGDNVKVFLSGVAAGGIGGLLNGYVFLKYMKPIAREQI